MTDSPRVRAVASTSSRGWLTNTPTVATNGGSRRDDRARLRRRRRRAGFAARTRSRAHSLRARPPAARPRARRMPHTLTFVDQCASPAVHAAAPAAPRPGSGCVIRRSPTRNASYPRRARRSMSARRRDAALGHRGDPSGSTAATASSTVEIHRQRPQVAAVDADDARAGLERAAQLRRRRALPRARRGRARRRARSSAELARASARRQSAAPRRRRAPPPRTAGTRSTMKSLRRIGSSTAVADLRAGARARRRRRSARSARRSPRRRPLHRTAACAAGVVVLRGGCRATAIAACTRR